MMESVAENKKETGEVQEIYLTQNLEQDYHKRFQMILLCLLANSKQALLDFANIQTTEDIASFNQQYDVNLSMPSGA